MRGGSGEYRLSLSELSKEGGIKVVSAVPARARAHADALAVADTAAQDNSIRDITADSVEVVSFRDAERSRCLIFMSWHAHLLGFSVIGKNLF
jgi:hypothetical protein